MGFLNWSAEHWVELFQTYGIIVGNIFTIAALVLDRRTRRITNLIEINKDHREIWSELYKRPELIRISEIDVDLSTSPIKPEENLFISLLILHLNCAYQAMKNDLYTEPEGMREDIRQFFSRPMAIAVWDKLKVFQDKDFVKFVETSRKS